MEVSLSDVYQPVGSMKPLGDGREVLLLAASTH